MSRIIIALAIFDGLLHTQASGIADESYGEPEFKESLDTIMRTLMPEAVEAAAFKFKKAQAEEFQEAVNVKAGQMKKTRDAANKAAIDNADKVLHEATKRRRQVLREGLAEADQAMVDAEKYKQKVMRDGLEYAAKALEDAQAKHIKVVQELWDESRQAADDAGNRHLQAARTYFNGLSEAADKAFDRDMDAAEEGVRKWRIGESATERLHEDQENRLEAAHRAKRKAYKHARAVLRRVAKKDEEKAKEEFFKERGITQAKKDTYIKMHIAKEKAARWKNHADNMAAYRVGREDDWADMMEIDPTEEKEAKLRRQIAEE